MSSQSANVRQLFAMTCWLEALPDLLQERLPALITAHPNIERELTDLAESVVEVATETAFQEFGLTEWANRAS